MTDIDQKVPIPGLEVDEDDGRCMPSVVMGEVMAWEA